MTNSTRTFVLAFAMLFCIIGCGKSPSKFDQALKELAEGKSDTIDCRGMPGIGDAQMAVLAKAPGLDKLQVLVLDDSQVTDDGILELPWMPSLTTFAASKTRITDRGLGHLKNVANIETLRLDEDHVTDQGLANLTNLPSIRNLSLWRCAITDAGLPNLTKLPNLEILSLDETVVTGAGVRKHLTGCKRLQSVRLWKTGVTPEDASELRKANTRLEVNL